MGVELQDDAGSFIIWTISFRIKGNSLTFDFNNRVQTCND